MMPRIVFTRQVENKIAKAMHDVIRKNLHLDRDYDPKTGEYLEQPEFLKPEYEMTQNVTLNILGDTFIDMAYTDQVIEDKSYIRKTRAGIFTV